MFCVSYFFSPGVEREHCLGIGKERLWLPAVNKNCNYPVSSSDPMDSKAYLKYKSYFYILSYLGL